MISSFSTTDCKHLLRRNYIGQLAYVYQNKPFSIPITYYFTEDKIICYSGDGHKISAMRLRKEVSLQVAEIDEINKWKSVIAHGTFRELQGSEAKAYLHEFSLGVKDVISVKELRDLDYISQFSARISKDDYPIVFIIEINEYSGRMRS